MCSCHFHSFKNMNYINEFNYSTQKCSFLSTNCFYSISFNFIAHYDWILWSELLKLLKALCALLMHHRNYIFGIKSHSSLFEWYSSRKFHTKYGFPEIIIPGIKTSEVRAFIICHRTEQDSKGTTCTCLRL